MANLGKSERLRDSKQDDHTFKNLGRSRSQNVSLPTQSRPPKSRPPKSLRDRLGVTKTLPRYSGSYSVGTLEIEVPVKNPHTVSNITRDKQHVLQLETVLMNVFYPSALGSGSGKPPSGQGRWARETWLPRPRREMARAYGDFGGVGAMAVPFFGITSMLTKLPAFRNAELAKHWPPSENVRTAGVKAKNMTGPPPEGESETPTFPLAIFSHGLGGTRTMYSSICGELASYGFVVVALEHRDGSGPRTFVNHQPSGEGSREEREEHGGVDHTDKQRKKGYDTVEYIWPKNNPRDTMPNSEDGVDRELRMAQIELRKCEVLEAFGVLQEIAAGRGEEIAAKNMRRKGFKGASSNGLDGIDWSKWNGRFHTNHVVMLGHSFGAATTIEALRDEERFPFLAAGVAYDTWGVPLLPLESEREQEKHLARPIIAINSEAFSYWKRNFDMVGSVIDEARSQGMPAWNMTLRGTVHVSQSDFSILYPTICSMALKALADPQRALDLNINATLEFLLTVLPHQYTLVLRSLSIENVLAVATVGVDSIGSDQLHQPNSEYVAMKLKIPNEVAWRLNPHLARKQAGKKNHKEAGRGLKPGDEIWMHSAPTEDEKRTFFAKHGQGQDTVDPIQRFLDDKERQQRRTVT